MPARSVIVRGARAGDVEVAELWLPRGSRTSALTLDEIEMLFVSQGELSVLSPSGHRLRAGTAILRRLDINVAMFATRDTRLVCLRVPIGFRGADRKSVETLEPWMPMPDAAAEDFRRLQRTLSTLSSPDSLALEALALLITAWGEATVAKASDGLARPRWMGDVMAALSDITHPARLESLGRIAGVSPARLARVFKDLEGCTVGEFQRRLKVAAACRLLQESSSPLSHIAIATGFSDQAHFSRIFKRRTGKTPSDFRNSAPGFKRHYHEQTFNPVGRYLFKSKTADGRPYDGEVEIGGTAEGYTAVLRTSVMPDVAADIVAVTGSKVILIASVPAGMAVVQLRVQHGRLEGAWRLAGRATELTGYRVATAT